MVVFGGATFEPSRVRVRLPGRHARAARGVLRTALSRFAAGLLGGFVVGLGYGPSTTVVWALAYGFPPHSGAAVFQITLINMLVTGIVFGLSAGLVFGLVAALETPLDIDFAASPVSLLRTNRTTVIRQVLVIVPVFTVLIAFGGRVVADLLQPVLGPLHWPLSAGLLIGVVGGVGGGLSYALAFTAWGQWLVLSRVWWSLTGRLPWTVFAFLEDAYDRGVLRQYGAAYQFRHAELQDHFGRASGPPAARPGHVAALSRRT
jgi:hypothetical protein